MARISTDRRSFITGAAGAASILALAACGGSATGEGEKTPDIEEQAEEENASARANTLNVGQTAIAVGPNIWSINDLNSAVIMNLVCPAAVALDGEGRKFGFLTEEPISNDDATEWTITLKEGLSWNDGTPVSAEDVLFGARYGFEKGIALFSAYFGDVDFDASEVADKRTVIFRLYSPDVNFWNGAGFWVPFLRKSIWEKVSTPSSFNLDYPGDGYGPYCIDEWVNGSHVHLVRNEHYTLNGGGGALVNDIFFRFFKNEDEALDALEAGTIDAISNPLSVFGAARMAEGGSCIVGSAGTLGFSAISFSQHVDALCDVAVRRAIAACIDRDTLCETAWRGAAMPMQTPVSPVFFDLTTANIVQPAYDPKMAAEILEEAGWTDPGDGVRERDGELLDFSITYRSTLPNIDTIISIIADDLAKAGIRLGKNPVDAATFTSKVRNAHDFELAYISWSALDDVDSVLYRCFGIDEPLNIADFEDWEQEELLQSMRYEGDYDARKELLDQWQAWFCENLPCVHISVPVNSYAASTAVFDGWKLVSDGFGFLSCASFQNVGMR